jgi:hypothetical protein
MNVRRAIHLPIVAVLLRATAPAVRNLHPAHVASPAERGHVPPEEAEVRYIPGRTGRPRRGYDHQHPWIPLSAYKNNCTNHAMFGGSELLVSSTRAV